MPTTSNPAKRRRPKAGLLPFRNQHGGRRAGAGRKPKGDRAGVKHRVRQPQASRFPAHVTVKLHPGLPKLRQRATYAALREAFVAGSEPLGRGIQGLLIRIARRLNKHWNRRGKVFADRFHDHVLKTPREVRNALRYVLGNGKKHAAEGRHITVPQAIDTFTSAPWFDGWKERLTVNGLDDIPRPVANARTWLLTIGWRRHGLLSVHELPTSA